MRTFKSRLKQLLRLPAAAKTSSIIRRRREILLLLIQHTKKKIGLASHNVKKVYDKNGREVTFISPLKLSKITAGKVTAQGGC